MTGKTEVIKTETKIHVSNSEQVKHEFSKSNSLNPESEHIEDSDSLETSKEEFASEELTPPASATAKEESKMPAQKKNSQVSSKKRIDEEVFPKKTVSIVEPVSMNESSKEQIES